MKINYLILITVLIIGSANCHSQNNNKMKQQNNPLMCDPESGICEIPANETNSKETSLITAEKKPVKIIYFTDPICSSCWGIEPQLRKLKLEYGNLVEVEYRMGGMLKDWSYNSGGISKPSDVAHHWDEVSVYYDMPMVGDVWIEDPLHSSFPPSIAFKAAEIQDKDKAILFLREIREMVFLQKKNITKWEYLELAAQKVGLNILKFKTDYEGKAKELFEEDLQLGRELGLRGFPTMFFKNTTGQVELVYGSKPYNTFENTVLKLYPTASKNGYDKTWNYVFSKYRTLTAKEFSELTGLARSESEKLLNELTVDGKLEKITSKNGSIWIRNNTIQ
jgi:predicted DsbA family dithiol-disulfide isomerase